MFKTCISSLRGSDAIKRKVLHVINLSVCLLIDCERDYEETANCPSG